MRKGKLGLQALETIDLAKKQNMRSPYAAGDQSWSLIEAAGIETPVGEVHLHWFNHRGRGGWRFSQKGTTVCKTVRCRVVTITPHGGENECAPINNPDMTYVWQEWADRKDAQRQRELDERRAVDERLKSTRLSQAVAKAGERQRDDGQGRPYDQGPHGVPIFGSAVTGDVLLQGAANSHDTPVP